MSSVPLSDLRWGRAIDLLPSQGKTGSAGRLPGQDASGASSLSPDSARDWTITADRVSTGSGILAKFNLVIQWGTGGLQQEVSVPLSPLGIVFHVVGTDVKTFVEPVDGDGTWEGTDVVRINVAPGRPARNRVSTHARVENEDETPANRSALLQVPNYARRMRVRPIQVGGGLPVPFNLQIVESTADAGNRTVWNDPVPLPYYVDVELVFGAFAVTLTALELEPDTVAHFFVEWELDL
jgi:hypothetical protein